MPVLARLLLALCAVVLLSPGTVRAQAEEWTVYTSVVDQNGSPVMGLTAVDFVVRENGVAREILRVSPATDSLQVAVLNNQYQVVYARPRTLIPPKTIDVGVVKRPDVIVRAPRVL